MPIGVLDSPSYGDGKVPRAPRYRLPMFLDPATAEARAQLYERVQAQANALVVKSNKVWPLTVDLPAALRPVAKREGVPKGAGDKTVLQLTGPQLQQHMGLDIIDAPGMRFDFQISYKSYHEWKWDADGKHGRAWLIAESAEAVFPGNKLVVRAKWGFQRRPFAGSWAPNGDFVPQPQQVCGAPAFAPDTPEARAEAAQAQAAREVEAQAEDARSAEQLAARVAENIRKLAERRQAELDRVRAYVDAEEAKLQARMDGRAALVAQKKRALEELPASPGAAPAAKRSRRGGKAKAKSPAEMTHDELMAEVEAQRAAAEAPPAALTRKKASLALAELHKELATAARGVTVRQRSKPLKVKGVLRLDASEAADLLGSTERKLTLDNHELQLMLGVCVLRMTAANCFPQHAKYRGPRRSPWMQAVEGELTVKPNETVVKLTCQFGDLYDVPQGKVQAALDGLPP